MRKRILSGLIFVSMLISLCGCTGTENSNSNKDTAEKTSATNTINDKEYSNTIIYETESTNSKTENIINTNGTYIEVRELFVSRYNNSTDFNGKAYTVDLEHDLLRFLYLNNNEFTHCYEASPQIDKFYSGTYQINEKNQLIFNYCNSWGNNYEKNTQWNYFINNHSDESRTAQAHISIMESANDNECMTRICSSFNPYDNYKYIHAPYCLNIGKKYSWHEFVGTTSFDTKVYLKNDFIVTEQKGYYFNEIKSENEFSLKYDNFEFSEDYCNMSINFYEDNTYEITTCKEYNSYKGIWDLLEEHLLIIHAPNNNEFENCDFAFNLLYLDFETKQIFSPLFIKRNDIVLPENLYNFV